MSRFAAPLVALSMFLVALGLSGCLSDKQDIEPMDEARVREDPPDEPLQPPPDNKDPSSLPEGVSCPSPGAGPATSEPSWYVGQFPLEPILELYGETQCRTLSPALIWRLVTDLPAYLAEAGAVSLEARPGALGEAVTELTGLSAPLLRRALELEEADDLDEALRTMLRLYALQERSDQDTEAWRTWLKAHPLVAMVQQLNLVDDVLVGLYVGWGIEQLATCLCADGEEQGDWVERLERRFYLAMLGVDRDQALALLEQAGISPDETLGAFLSLIHVSPPVDGMRTAYVFVSDRDTAPISGLGAADFSITEGGVRVPAGEIEVRSLGAAADRDGGQPEFSLSLVLDYSGSMSARDKAFLEEGLLYLFEVLPPVYRAGVIKFTSETAIYQRMTSDREEIMRAVRSGMEPGRTSLYDAMALGLDELAREQTPLRLQLAFTDGMENASSVHCHDSVVRYSDDLGAPVFVIGMGRIDVPAMVTMSNETNGCFLYAPSNQSIREIYEFASDFISETYIVRWPAATDDRKPRLSVTARTPEGELSDELVP